MRVEGIDSGLTKDKPETSNDVGVSQLFYESLYIAQRDKFASLL